MGISSFPTMPWAGSWKTCSTYQAQLTAGPLATTAFELAGRDCVRLKFSQ